MYLADISLKRQWWHLGDWQSAKRLHITEWNVGVKWTSKSVTQRHLVAVVITGKPVLQDAQEEKVW